MNPMDRAAFSVQRDLPGRDMDKRQAPRFKARFDAIYSSGSAEGTGVVRDLSYFGARLEDVSLWPALGTVVRLYVFIQPVTPFELVGRVVRRTESGFAIEWDLADLELQRLIDDLSALVAAPD